MKKFASHFFYSLVEWLFRRRSSALYAMRVGLLLIALAFGAAWNMDISYREGMLSSNISNGGSIPIAITYLFSALGAFLIISGFILEVNRLGHERKKLLRKKIIVIESRGLRDTSGTPLQEALPQKLEGQHETFLIDIRENIKDGVIAHPEAALPKIIPLTNYLKQKANGYDRADLTIVYGGLTPVPFTFLIGLVADDEGKILSFDWDRHKENWRPLDGEDDSKRFVVSGLDSIAADTIEVALAISVSYRVDLDGVQKKVGNMHLIHMELEDGSPDCHWSEEKQQALGKEFLKTVVLLGNKDINKIHLFFAAPNSVVFRFGRLYDKRNLPAIVVYQYQREATPPYPWGVLMPVQADSQPIIIKS